MKQRYLILTLVFIALGFAGCATYIDGLPRPAGPPASRLETSLFWDALAPYGDWLWVDPWGWVWTPWDIGPGWRPYTDGHWVWTYLGWTWVADQSWGWAPFHYGRWTHHLPYGWIWIPDTVWAPAWVAWRAGQGWIGWAPLPPEIHWRIGIGLDLGDVDLGLSIVGHGWSFCDQRDFLDRRIGRRLAPLPRNAHLLRETRSVTRYEEVERQVAIRSFSAEDIEAQTGTVPHYRIENIDRPPHRGEAITKDAVRVYRPEVKAWSPGGPKRRAAPPLAEITTSREQLAAIREQEIERRRARELRALRIWEEEQRENLEKAQQRERRQPSAKVDPAELELRQEEERRTLRKEVEREKKILDNRVERRAKAESRQAKPGLLAGTKRLH